jgi:hypothetical protein
MCWAACCVSQNTVFAMVASLARVWCPGASLALEVDSGVLSSRNVVLCTRAGACWDNGPSPDITALSC